ncbi:Putative protein-L-isoaspartate carboxylmethyltransferase [Methanocella conradii HZ254]|uniref:Methyltransferase domain-containing protein n=2 Tax=Methanocella TaxID=570266 RepID=H8IAP5_METCZ|nr:Putative protein-L-isoaspartate carboxylmethyltransferase [Methanocella conradii HZ254]
MYHIMPYWWDINSMAEFMGNVIDWGELWKQKTAGKKECSMLWHDKKYAGRYDENVKANNWRKGRRLIRELNVTMRSRVLDIGAGPGTLTIPIASMVKHVTAVEPADGMMWYLKKNIAEKGLDNVACVHKKWEDVDIAKDLEGPYDVVVASLSLGMPDIKAALEKMNAASSAYVYLFWPAGVTYWEANYAEIWHELHGKEFRHGPRCDCLYNILYGMGIYPNIKMYKDEYLESFSNINDAVEYYRPFYNIENYRQEAILRDFLRKKLIRKNGRLILKGYSNIAKIWWKKRYDY